MIYICLKAWLRRISNNILKPSETIPPKRELIWVVNFWKHCMLVCLWMTKFKTSYNKHSNLITWTLFNTIYKHRGYHIWIYKHHIIYSKTKTLNRFCMVAVVWKNNKCSRGFWRLLGPITKTRPHFFSLDLPKDSTIVINFVRSLKHLPTMFDPMVKKKTKKHWFLICFNTFFVVQRVLSFHLPVEQLHQKDKPAVGHRSHHPTRHRWPQPWLQGCRDTWGDADGNITGRRTDQKHQLNAKKNVKQCMSSLKSVYTCLQTILSTRNPDLKKGCING